MIRFLLSFLLALVCSGSGFSQITYQKAIGGAQNDLGRGIEPTSDGGFILSAETNSYGAGNMDAWLVKVDSLGTVQWSRAIGGNRLDWGYDVQEVSDGYIFSGATQSYGYGSHDFFIGKLNLAGSVQWTRTFGGFISEYGRNIELLPDSTLMLSGYFTSNSFGANDAILIKMDLSGNQIYATSYGGTANDFPHNIHPLPNNGILTTGYRRNYPGANWRGWMMETDSSGLPVMQFEFGIAGRELVFNHGEITPDNGYLLAGSHRSPNNNSSYDGIIIKLDSTGTIEWQKHYSGPSLDMIMSVAVHPDSGYVLFGVTESMGGGRGIFAIRTNSRGDIMWQRNYGGNADENLISTSEPAWIMPDKGLVIYGSTRSYGAGGDDLILLRTNPNGMIPGCVIDTSRLLSAGFPSVTRYSLTMSRATNTLGLTVTAQNSATNPDTSELCCPVPAAWFSSSGGCDGLPVTFQDSSSDLLNPGFFWDFNNDGIPDDSSGALVAHTFPGPGTYPVTLIIRNQCASSDTITRSITVWPQPTGFLGNDTTVCQGNGILLDPGSGYSNYVWSTGNTAQTQQVLSSGIFSLTLTNQGGCPGADTIQVTTISSPSVNLGPDVSICIPNMHTIQSGITGVSYLWSTGQTSSSITVNTSGNYSLTVTSPNGCTDVDSINVQVFSSLPVNIGPNQSGCRGDTLTLDAGFLAGGAYFWSTGETTQQIQVTQSGNYWVIVTSPPGCSGSDTARVTIHPLPNVTLGNDTAFCNAQPYTLVAFGGNGTYDWSNGYQGVSQVITNGGNYAVTLTDVHGCTDADTVSVTALQSPDPELGPDITACEGDPITLTPAGTAAQYNWSTGASSGSIDPTQSGIYVVTLTASNGCSTSDSVSVTFSPIPQVDLGPDRSICRGDFQTFGNPVPGGSYAWSTGAAASSISVVQSGTYSLTVTIPPGCSSADTVNLTVNPVPVLDLGPDTSFCAGDTLWLYADTAQGIPTWNNAGSQSTYPVISQEVVGLVIRNRFGCSASDQISVHQIDSFQLELGPDTTLCGKGPVLLGTGLSEPSQQWSTGASGSEIEILQTGTYSVAVSNSCFSRSDTVYVELLGQSDGPFLPNAFTPNGDGLNDVFQVTGEEIEGMELAIFDRWGNLVFQTRDPNAYWDGRVAGQDAPEGGYSYSFSFSDCKGEYRVISGMILLIR